MRNNQHEPIFFTPPSGDTKRARTLYKGGGGGDGGAAKRKAAEDARIADAINSLNQIFGLAQATPEAVDRNSFIKKVPIKVNDNPQTQGFLSFTANNKPQTQDFFDSVGYNAAVAASKQKADKLKGAAQGRERLYSKISSDTKNYAMTDLNKERGIAERDLNFILARNGLSGGSRDVDANKDVLDKFNQGVLKASNLGLQTANNARSNDEKTRVNLINSIHAGLSDGDAQQQAYQGMANNAKQAQDDANSASLVGFFDVLRNQQQQAQYLQGVNGVASNQQFKNPLINSNITQSYQGK